MPLLLLLFREFLEVLIRFLQVSFVNYMVALGISSIFLGLVIQEVVILIFFSFFTLLGKINCAQVVLHDVCAYAYAAAFGILLLQLLLLMLPLGSQHRYCRPRVIHNLVPSHGFVLRWFS